MEGESMSSGLAAVSTRKEKAAKATAALHSHRNLISSCIKDWEELERSFGITERALQQKFIELADREKEYDSKMQEARVAIDKRAESIAGLEETSLARVQEQKVTALAAIAEERKKLEEEQREWRAEKQAAMKVTTEAMVQDEEIEKASKGASNSADHSPSKDTQQKNQKQGLDMPAASKESKDPVATALKETKNANKQTIMKDSSTFARDERKKAVKGKERGKKTGQQLKDEQMKEGGKMEGQRDEGSKNKRKEAPPVDEEVAKRQKGLSVLDSKAVGEISNDAPSLEDAITSVQIKSCVDKLDWEGLRDVVVNNRKDSQKLRPELQAALQASSDPCRLLLKVLEGSEGTNRVALNNKTGQACIVLLECLSEVVADPVLGVDYPVVPSDSKEIARAIARRWKSKLEVHSQDGHAVGSHLFLQLLASFGIGTDYSDEDLLNYVVSMSRRITGPALCRSLGLTEKIPVAVDRLAKEGKQIDAISLASAFNILDKFSIVTLLKSYLEDSRKANDLDKAGSKGSGTLTKQISALKNAVKVIEEHNLGSQFPLEDLCARISVLSQERAEKKKASTNSKQEDTASHGVESGRPNIAGNIDDAAIRSGLDSTLGKQGNYVNAPERGHYNSGDLGPSIRGEYIPTNIGRPLLPPYNVDGYYRYERRPESTYDGYGMGRRSPVSLSNSYKYSSSGTFSSGLGSHLPTINTYNGMSRDELLRGRPSYPEIPGPSSNYQLGSLPASSNYLPYYLR